MSEEERQIESLLTISFIGIIILLLMSGCSITANKHFERQISENSICWQDDEHFLVYCSIEQYYFTPNFLGNDDIHMEYIYGGN